MGRACYDGKITINVLDKLRPVVTATLKNLVEEMVKDRIERALINAKETQLPSDEQADAGHVETSESPKAVVTTEEELQAYFAVKAMLSESFDLSQISYKDTKHYFSVLYGGMVSKWICRLRMGANKKFVCIPDDSGQEARHEISSVDDIFKLRNEIRFSAQRFV